VDSHFNDEPAYVKQKWQKKTIQYLVQIDIAALLPDAYKFTASHNENFIRSSGERSRERKHDQLSDF
jgi:hypothetical protein